MHFHSIICNEGVLFNIYKIKVHMSYIYCLLKCHSHGTLFALQFINLQYAWSFISAFFVGTVKFKYNIAKQINISSFVDAQFGFSCEVQKLSA